MIGVTLIALLIRAFRISQPHQVVFEEANAGDAASQYITGSFFTDAEPPFGKLLLTAVAYFFGYDGQFNFNESAA